MKTLLLIALTIVLGVGSGLIGRAVYSTHTTVRGLELALNPTTLAEHAQLIVVGQLTGPKSWTDATSGTDPVVLTDWQVQPKEVLKGQAPKKLVVTILGGQDDGQSVSVEGAPVIHAGQTMLMYLTYESTQQRWIPLSLTQGLLTPSGTDDIDGGGQHRSDRELRQAITNVGSSVTPLQ